MGISGFGRLNDIILYFSPLSQLSNKHEATNRQGHIIERRKLILVWVNTKRGLDTNQYEEV
jgi:hypothetical protein